MLKYLTLTNKDRNSGRSFLIMFDPEHVKQTEPYTFDFLSRKARATLFFYKLVIVIDKSSLPD